MKIIRKINGKNISDAADIENYEITNQRALRLISTVLDRVNRDI